ncbi:adenylate/guanylate cyclase domain-containing protein [Sinorhizobium sp. BG8]|uniref:adenylate/guanylate cyclase domain-containing protein n=1 Tax=Sinorhizobium sp. BG8 TaxID=2613773 RepID=UPI00193D22EB|nr:adenylate/guanylate cyclase domain-containing protein [Sinorhizobium sp. BG8]QRM55282.1 adenylate/guanylate cyclase domain-containing protein [Sinorhizobium sp. BG8]
MIVKEQALRGQCAWAGRNIDPDHILAVLEWLAGEECHAFDEVGLIAELGTRLRKIGLPIDRLTLHLMTLHPEILGRTLAWSPSEPVEILDRAHGIKRELASSPVIRVLETGQPLIVDADDVASTWQHVDVFAKRNLAQVMIAPLRNIDGSVSAAGFGTKRPGGFTVSEIRAIERLLPALRNACEMRVLRHAELSLLETYIGPMTARRILAGKIRRGDIETIQAALLLCDMKGFTELSNRLLDEKVLELLNAYFDMVVPAITAHDGEVLKFIGDAVLAFFPAADAVVASRQALATCEEIFSRLADFEMDGVRIEATAALHYGSASYGNIGSGGRLDFTVIGSDINLLSRIQGACSGLGKSILMSDAFRRRAEGEHVVSVSFHHLKGFSEPIELFTFAD